MADLPQADDDTITEGDAPTASPAPRRGPGHRAADARDTAAEMAQRAQKQFPRTGQAAAEDHRGGIEQVQQRGDADGERETGEGETAGVFGRRAAGAPPLRHC